MVRMVLPVGVETALHLVVPHRQVAMVDCRQAILATPQEALVHPEVLPEVVVVAMAMIVETVTFQESRRVRMRRNQMAKVLKMKRNNRTKRKISMPIVSDGHVVAAHRGILMITVMMRTVSSQIQTTHSLRIDGSGCSVRGENEKVVVWL